MCVSVAVLITEMGEEIKPNRYKMFGSELKWREIIECFNFNSMIWLKSTKSPGIAFDSTDNSNPRASSKLVPKSQKQHPSVIELLK